MVTQTINIFLKIGVFEFPAMRELDGTLVGDILVAFFVKYALFAILKGLPS